MIARLREKSSRYGMVPFLACKPTDVNIYMSGQQWLCRAEAVHCSSVRAAPYA